MSVQELESKLEALRIQRDAVSAEIAAIYKELRIETDNIKGSDMKTVIFPIVRDFHCLVGKHWTDQDALSLGLLNCPTMLYPDGTTIWEILVDGGAFESKGQARKNWRGITTLPFGWTELGPIGKAKLHIFIWNPEE
jgi:hypothetical protein